MEEILAYQSVEVCFAGQAVVHDVSFSLHAGEILGIVGESGSGKSTILKACMGLLGNSGMVTRGDIWFQGKDIPDLSEKELRGLRGKEIGMIFQDAGASLARFVPLATRFMKVLPRIKKQRKKKYKKMRWNSLKNCIFTIRTVSGAAILLNFREV